MTAALQVRNLTVRFGGVTALDNVNLEVDEGTCCSVIGPNGSGKSTLLGVLSRLTEPTSGSIHVFGEDYTTVPKHEPIHLGIARTFQTVRLLDELTVLENVMLGASRESAGRSHLGNWIRSLRAIREDRELRRLAREALDRVGLSDWSDEYPDQLPYGHQRRVEIARVLAGRPRIMLMDEPFAGMSREEREGIMGLLMELREKGLTQVLVEHDLSMVARLSDWVHVLNFGSVIASGTYEAVAAHPEVRTAYIGDATDEEAEVASG